MTDGCREEVMFYVDHVHVDHVHVDHVIGPAF